MRAKSFGKIAVPTPGTLVRLAGHSTVRMTEGYTKMQLNRQADLTRRIQERLASAGEKLTGEPDTDCETPAPPTPKFAEMDATVTDPKPSTKRTSSPNRE